MKIKGYCREKVTKPDRVAEIFRAILAAEDQIDQDKEHFWTVGLNQNNGIKYIELVSLGTLNASLVHPREVFRMAILEATAAILLVHNHPSGNPNASDDDLKVVKRISEAGAIIGIKLMDSIIVAGDQYLSWQESGLL